MVRIELSRRAELELFRMDSITSSLIKGWLIRNVKPLSDPKSIGTSLGGRKRWQYRIGDYRVLTRITEKRAVILAITHGHELPSQSSWMRARPPIEVSL